MLPIGPSRTWLILAAFLAGGCDGFYRVRGRAVDEAGDPLAATRVVVRMERAGHRSCEDGWPVGEMLTAANGIYDIGFIGPFPFGDWDPDDALSVKFERNGRESACVLVAHVQHGCADAPGLRSCWTVDGVLRPAGVPLPVTPSLPPKPEHREDVVP